MAEHVPAPDGPVPCDCVFVAAYRFMRRCLEWALILPVRLYQLCISPMLPDTCRFTPSCSQYMIDAIRKRGPIIGPLKGLWRLMRCNPLFPGGYDPAE